MVHASRDEGVLQLCTYAVCLATSLCCNSAHSAPWMLNLSYCGVFKIVICFQSVIGLFQLKLMCRQHPEQTHSHFPLLIRSPCSLIPETQKKKKNYKKKYQFSIFAKSRFPAGARLLAFLLLLVLFLRLLLLISNKMPESAR